MTSLNVNLYGFQLGVAPRTMLQRIYNVLGGEFPHNQSQLAVLSRHYRRAINVLDVLRDTTASTSHFDNKLGDFHGFHYSHLTPLFER